VLLNNEAETTLSPDMYYAKISYTTSISFQLTSKIQ